MSELSGNYLVIYFDGVCNLCNYFINFLIKRDKNKIFKYASLQGESAKKLGLSVEGKEGKNASVVVIIEGQAFYESDAVLKILEKLGGFWAMFSCFKFTPKFIRDLIYRLVAKNRYKIFGQSSQCRLPTAEERESFID